MRADTPAANTSLIVLEGRSDVPLKEVPSAMFVTEVTLRDLSHPGQPVVLDTSRQTGNLFRIKYALCQVRLKEVYELTSKVYSGTTLTHEGRLPVMLVNQDQQDLVIPVARQAAPATSRISQLVTIEGSSDWVTRERRDPDLITEVSLIDITDPALPVTLDVSKKTGNQFELKYALCQVQSGHIYQVSSRVYQQGKVTHSGGTEISLDGTNQKGLFIEVERYIELQPR